MPQAPLPALPARTVPTDLIHPIVTGTSTPMNVVASQYLPQWNLPDALTKGFDIGRGMLQIPKEKAQALTQKAIAEIANQHTKATLDQFKAIDKMGLSASDNMKAKTQALIQSGIQYGVGGGAINPEVPINVYGTNFFQKGGWGNQGAGGQGGGGQGGGGQGGGGQGGGQGGGAGQGNQGSSGSDIDIYNNQVTGNS